MPAKEARTNPVVCSGIRREGVFLLTSSPIHQQGTQTHPAVTCVVLGNSRDCDESPLPLFRELLFDSITLVSYKFFDDEGCRTGASASICSAAVTDIFTRVLYRSTRGGPGCPIDRVRIASLQNALVPGQLLSRSFAPCESPLLTLNLKQSGEERSLTDAGQQTLFAPMTPKRRTSRSWPPVRFEEAPPAIPSPIKPRIESLHPLSPIRSVNRPQPLVRASAPRQVSPSDTSSSSLDDEETTFAYQYRPSFEHPSLHDFYE